MAIDIHCHLFMKEQDTEGPEMRSMAEMFSTILGRQGRTLSASEIRRDIYSRWVDPTGEATVQTMDDAGIDATVVFLASFSLSKLKDIKEVARENGKLAGIAKEHPDRLIPFFIAHPLCDGLPNVFDDALKAGMKGLKLDPLAGKYYLDDKRLYPLYEIASSKKVPVLCHTGSRPDDPEQDYPNPTRLSQVLADFPNLTLVAAHMAFGWWRDLIKIAEKRPNLTCDFSSFQLTASLNLGQFCHILRQVLDAFGAERVLFGSDGPCFDVFISRKNWVELIKRLPAEAPQNTKFTDGEVEAILDGNARRILRLNSRTTEG